MKIVRFYSKDFPDDIQFGILKGDHIRAIVTDPFIDEDIVPSPERYELDEVKILAPCSPSKIVAVGLNYHDHAKELGMAIPNEPLIFLKPSTSVIGPEDKIIIPKMSKRVDHEAELGVIIKKKAKNISRDNALDVVLGFTCVNDVTARDLQKKDIQFTRSKSFDTFCPIGPCIETDIDPHHLKIECLVNGEVKQSSNTENLIHSVEELISFISKIMTLLPGDVISTGTPPGISPLSKGDEVIVKIEGIGELKNKVDCEI